MIGPSRHKKVRAAVCGAQKGKAGLAPGVKPRSATGPFSGLSRRKTAESHRRAFQVTAAARSADAKKRIRGKESGAVRSPPFDARVRS